LAGKPKEANVWVKRRKVIETRRDLLFGLLSRWNTLWVFEGLMLLLSIEAKRLIGDETSTEVKMVRFQWFLIKSLSGIVVFLFFLLWLE
jgi:hypothetical protein